jgi:hypothetical protein
MGNIAALQSIWPSLSGTTKQKLASLNDMMVAGPSQDVPCAQIWTYLAQRGLIAKLEAYAANPPQGAAPQTVMSVNYMLAMLADTARDKFATSDPVVLSQAQAFAAALVADPATGVSQSDGNALLAMTQTKAPWWEANGYTKPIGIDDLIEAGNLY